MAKTKNSPPAAPEVGARVDRAHVLKHIMGANPPAQVREGQLTPDQWGEQFLSDEPQGYTLMHVHPRALNYPAAPDMAKVADYAERDGKDAPPIVVDSNDKMQVRDGSGPHDTATKRVQRHTVVDGKHRAAAAALRGDDSILAYVPTHKAAELRRDSHRHEVEGAARDWLESKGHEYTGRDGSAITFRAAGGGARSVHHNDMKGILEREGKTWRFGA